jgi:hypothetical protein
MDVASNDTGEEVDASFPSEPAEEESIGSTRGVEDKVKGDAESAYSSEWRSLIGVGIGLVLNMALAA